MAITSYEQAIEAAKKAREYGDDELEIAALKKAKELKNWTTGMSDPRLMYEGAKKGLNDSVLGSGQFTREGLESVGLKTLADQIGLPNQQRIDELKKYYEPLMQTGAGKIGNILSGTLLTAPIPGANTYKGAALIGGLYSMLQPTETGESRALNAVIGTQTAIIGKKITDTAVNMAHYSIPMVVKAIKTGSLQALWDALPISTRANAVRKMASELPNVDRHTINRQPPIPSPAPPGGEGGAGWEGSGASIGTASP